MKKITKTSFLLLIFSVIVITHFSMHMTANSSERFKPVFQRGMSYATYANISSPNQYASALSDESLRRMKNVGVEWVAINVIWYQENLTTTHIYPNTSTYSPTNESLVHAIETCHELEMKVMLKPMIDCENGSWRGLIIPIPSWFGNYTHFISFFAELAEQHNVEMFCIGCELMNTALHKQDWRNVIESVRAKYTGPITYASTWGMYNWTGWWDVLDYIGINAWFNLTEQYDPTLSDLKQACISYLDEIESWWLGLNEPVQKPIIFTEIGYQSVNGTNRQPWNYSLMYSNSLDLQEQAECYEAAFQTLWNRNWLYGMYWWYWQTDPMAGLPKIENCTLVYNKDYTPQNKPAEGVVLHWYSKAKLTCSLSTREVDIDKGESVNITATLSPPLQGETVYIEKSNDTVNWDILASGITNSTGQYTYKWTPTTVGTHYIRVRWNGNESYECVACREQEIHVIPEFPLTVFLPWFVVTLIAVFFAYIIKVKMRKTAIVEKSV